MTKRGGEKLNHVDRKARTAWVGGKYCNKDKFPREKIGGVKLSYSNLQPRGA